jgi:hypothetical protein
MRPPTVGIRDRGSFFLNGSAPRHEPTDQVCVRGQMIERQLWSRTLCGTRQPALVLSCSSSLAIPVPLAQAPSVRFGSVRADGKMSAVGELVGAMLPDRALLPPLRRCSPDHPRPAERQAPRRRSGTPPPA